MKIIFLLLLFKLSISNAQEISFSVSNISYSNFYTQNSFKGKISIFSFIDVTCPHCNKHMESLTKDFPNFENDKFILKFISTNEREQTEDFLLAKQYQKQNFGILNKNTDIPSFFAKIQDKQMRIPYTIVFNSDSTLCTTTLNTLNKKSLEQLISTCK